MTGKVKTDVGIRAQSHLSRDTADKLWGGHETGLSEMLPVDIGEGAGSESFASRVSIRTGRDRFAHAPVFLPRPGRPGYPPREHAR